MMNQADDLMTTDAQISKPATEDVLRILEEVYDPEIPVLF